MHQCFYLLISVDVSGLQFAHAILPLNYTIHEAKCFLMAESLNGPRQCRPCHTMMEWENSPNHCAINLSACSCPYTRHSHPPTPPNKASHSHPSIQGGFTKNSVAAECPPSSIPAPWCVLITSPLYLAPIPLFVAPLIRTHLSLQVEAFTEVILFRELFSRYRTDFCLSC